MVFRDNLENELDNLYKQVKEGQALLIHIMQILPEGIIIFNKDETMSINYANLSAYKLFQASECDNLNEKDF
jgi:hypothetical protein